MDFEIFALLGAKYTAASLALQMWACTVLSVCRPRSWSISYSYYSCVLFAQKAHFRRGGRKEGGSKNTRADGDEPGTVCTAGPARLQNPGVSVSLAGGPSLTASAVWEGPYSRFPPSLLSLVPPSLFPPSLHPSPMDSSHKGGEEGRRKGEKGKKLTKYLQTRTEMEKKPTTR